MCYSFKEEIQVVVRRRGWAMKRKSWTQRPVAATGSSHWRSQVTAIQLVGLDTSRELPLKV